MKSAFLTGAVLLCAASAANPVGQVLELLQKLHDTVVADGEKEQKQFEAFAEWCEDESKERQFEIKTGTAQAENLRAVIEKAVADIDAVNTRIGEVSTSVAANEADLKAATDIRKKEHSTFKQEEQELVDTVDTLRRAQQVLSRQLAHGGSFAQMPKVLKDLTSSLSVIMDAAVFSTQDKAQLKAFLQAQEGQEGVDAPAVKAYESHSAGILDTLADMQEKAEGILAETRKTEVNARHSYELLEQSLKDELSVQRAALTNDKKQRAAATETKASAEGDLAATVKDLNEDKTYLKDLSQNCQQRAVDAEVSAKSRAEELQALEEARRIIAEATGGASGRQYREFIQMSAHSDFHTYDKVVSSIKALGKKDNDFAFTQLAGQIRAAVSMSANPFGKVQELIKSMITRLIVQAEEEASHKAFCDKETSANEAKRDKLQAESTKLSTRIEKGTATVAKLKEQVSELRAALASMAKSQKDLDVMRAEEHEEFVKSKADFEQGVAGVRGALKILRDYYANQGAALVQQPAVSVHAASADSSTGIISLLEVVESDFARSLAEAEAAEDDAQSVYEKTTQDNRVSTATKNASVQGKEQEAARVEQQINDSTTDRDGVNEELSAVLEYLEKLRPQCTTEPESYEERKARREHEIEGLKNAMNILENDTAFTQENASFLSVRNVKRHIA
eukprot:GEMP01021495.1.p1 GENE.GEMP01021495.1~~GEMP01021495.1.p1  ORF type:complete len:679 (+),score=280.44 GEMP01021495.1:99-2135(+)